VGGMKKCDRCAKPAVYHITEIRDGEAQAMHFCEQCAKQHLSHPDTENGPDSGGGEKALTGESDKFDEVDQQICPNCGISFKEFRSQGRLGCPHDYIAFQEELLPLLENIHGETQHIGKTPKRAPHASQKQYKLIKLRNRLRTAIDEEMYEEAARIRDEIQTAENELAADAPSQSASGD
jgi:protein arginine kinase activator